MRGSVFEFDVVNLLYYDFNKISLNRGGSYTDFPEWIKNKIELNNESIALKILYVPHKTGKIHLPYNSKHNLTREKQVILLIITDGEKWHYTPVKRFSGLLRGVTGSNNGDFSCLNCFHTYTTENKLEKHKRICENA